jgi:hypothetical protein
MSDQLFQNISTVQSGLQPTPITVTAAATIAPQSFITVITGNTAVSTIIPPVTGVHMLCIVPGTTTGFTTGGNINGSTVTISGRGYLFVYNPLTDSGFATTGGHYIAIVGLTT